jgi:acetyl esterase/lipase
MNRAGLGTRVVEPVLAHSLRYLTAAAFSPALIDSTIRLSALLETPLAVSRAPHGMRRRTVVFPNFRAEWLWHDTMGDPRAHTDAAILYLHGGAFVIGGLNSHRRLVARISQASGMPAFNVAYRQLPQARFPETLADAVAAYRHLLGRGFAPERIVICGDAAGGGLAVRLALAARDEGLPLPAAISALAPWADFDPAARNAHPNARRDSYLTALVLDHAARLGIAAGGALDPLWSPVNHHFAGLPRLLIQVGSNESLRCDAEQLAARCDVANVPCTLQIWDRAAHMHHAAADLLADARAAIAELGAFHRAALGPVRSA